MLMILKFTFRNLIKRPFLNLIKVLGLSLALSGILLIVVFLKNELSYDSAHEKSDRIYRFTTTSDAFFGGKHFARLNYSAYIPQMVEHFPELENYLRLVPIRGGFIKHEKKYIDVNQAFQCDSTFFKIFDAELLVGNSDDILNNPATMVISESLAKKIFGNQNPICQTLTLPSGQYYGENTDFTIKGIMKDFPQNSHFHPDFITTPTNKTIFQGWAWSYLLLSKNANPENIQAGFNDFYSSLVGDKNDEVKIAAHLQNICDIHYPCSEI